MNMIKIAFVVRIQIVWCRTFKDKQYFPRFALQLMLQLKPRLMLVFCMEPMDMVLVWAMPDLAMVPVLAMLV